MVLNWKKNWNELLIIHNWVMAKSLIQIIIIVFSNYYTRLYNQIYVFPAMKCCRGGIFLHGCSSHFCYRLGGGGPWQAQSPSKRLRAKANEATPKSTRAAVQRNPSSATFHGWKYVDLIVKSGRRWWFEWGILSLLNHSLGLAHFNSKLLLDQRGR